MRADKTLTYWTDHRKGNTTVGGKWTDTLSEYRIRAQMRFIALIPKRVASAVSRYCDGYSETNFERIDRQNLRRGVRLGRPMRSFRDKVGSPSD
jgi:hypothetical protein